jgi:hypothetical protein
MARQWSVVDFTETNSIGTYDPTKNSIFGGLENTNGLIRVPLPRSIPYLEQGNAALLANSVYADNNYIYTVSTMATGLTVRINRWNKTTLTWAGYIVIILPKTSEINTCRDLWVNSGSTEVLIAFTAATTIQGGIAWAYGLTTNDWGGTTLPAGLNTVAPRMGFLIRSGVIDRTVAVGAGTNFISYSTQNGTTLATQAGGATWTALTTIFTTSGWAVAYGGGLWVSGGEGTNSLAWSYDGITWTGIASGAGNFATRCRGVAYGEISGIGGRWVAVGVGTNSIIYSNDGINWVIPAQGVTSGGIFTTGAYGVCWDGSLFWAVGQGTNTLASSPDGIIWTGYGQAADGAPGHSPFSTAGYGIAFNGVQYVAMGIGGMTMAYSSNGTTWTACTTPPFTQGNAVCWGAPIGNIVTPGTAISSRWVAVGIGASHTIAYSTDGINWTGAGVTMFPAVSGGNGVCFNGTMFIAVGTKGAGSYTGAYSVDGATWNGVLTNLPQTIGQAVGCSPAPNMYPAQLGSINNVLQTIVSIDTSTPSGALNQGAGSFMLEVLQSTNTVASPALNLLDLGVLPIPKDGIITLPDTSRWSSAIITSEFASNLPSAALSQLIYAVPGTNHGAGITGVPAVFCTRGTSSARVSRFVLSRFTAATPITNRSRLNNTATLTFTGHSFTLNQYVYVQGVGGVGYNSGYYGKEPNKQVQITFVNATTIQYYNIGPNESITGDTGGRVIATIIGEDDYITEIPPLGATIQQAEQNWSGLAYDSYNDYFLILTNGSFRDYRTIYNPGMPMERFFGVINFETNPIASGSLPVVASSMLTARCGFGGRTLIIPRQGITAAVAAAQQLLLIEAGAQGGYVITPQIFTPNATAFYRVYTSEVRGGSGSYGKERYDIYYRTSGITDNTGAWTIINAEASLYNVVAAASIQFKIVFDILNWTCISPEITSLGLTWEDSITTDSHYQPSVGKSSVTAKQFAWRFATAFGYSVPNLRVRLYDAISGVMQCDDNTNTNPAAGTFEQSIDDGSNWIPWTNADKGNNITYLRYTPASTANNIRIKAVLTLL